MTFSHRFFGDSVEAGVRLARRRRAERRMIWLGRLAVFVPASALLLLALSVCGRAVHAFTEHYLVIDVPVTEELAAGRSMVSTVRRTLREAFPEARGRQGRRQLYALFSDVTAQELAAAVATAPEPPGEFLPVAFLASDDADLYLKGLVARPERRPGPTAVRLLPDGDDFVLEAVAPGSLEAVLVPFRGAFEARAARLEAEIRRQQQGAAVFRQRAGEAEDDGTREAMLEQARARDEKALSVRGAANRLLAAAVDQDLVVQATPELPSVLIAAGGGMLQATAISASRIRAVPLRQPGATGRFDAGAWHLQLNEAPAALRRISDAQIGWLEWLRAEGRVVAKFNARLFRAGDSREPELAGILGALHGSGWTMLVTFLLAFPLGAAAALYLEEFAPRNRFTELIEVNINNLGAVPSIIFGLLGLAVFLQFFGLPRSSPLVGGMTLALMTLPVVIIAGRASIRAVPPSIRDAAYGVGASRVQTAFHHVLPLAMPGMVTGAVLGLARAVGETAPLLLIGMVAFVAGTPEGPFDPAAALPALIFQWAEFPEPSFQHRAAAAILFLVLFLAILTTVANRLRQRFEKQW